MYEVVDNDILLWVIVTKGSRKNNFTIYRAHLSASLLGGGLGQIWSI